MDGIRSLERGIAILALAFVWSCFAPTGLKAGEDAPLLPSAEARLREQLKTRDLGFQKAAAAQPAEPSTATVPAGASTPAQDSSARWSATAAVAALRPWIPTLLVSTLGLCGGLLVWFGATRLRAKSPQQAKSAPGAKPAAKAEPRPKSSPSSDAREAQARIEQLEARLSGLESALLRVVDSVERVAQRPRAEMPIAEPVAPKPAPKRASSKAAARAAAKPLPRPTESVADLAVDGLESLDAPIDAPSIAASEVSIEAAADPRRIRPEPFFAAARARMRGTEPTVFDRDRVIRRVDLELQRATEAEQAAEAAAQLVAPPEPAPSAPTKKPRAPRASNAVRSVVKRRGTAPAASVPELQRTRELVLALAEQGWDRDRIAREARLPAGDVGLILKTALVRQTGESSTAESTSAGR